MITALLVTYDAEAYVGTAIEAALGAGVDEVLVLDNGSSDRTPEILRGLTSPRVRIVLSQDNLGFGRGMNRLAREASPGSDLLLLNPDCVLDSGVRSALEEVLVERPGVGAVAPGMRYPDGTTGISGGPAPTVLKELLAATRLDDRLPAPLRTAALRSLRHVRPLRGLAEYRTTLDGHGPVDLDWASGFCLLVRRAAWESVGGFDESFFLYFEDVDLCMRLRRAGWLVTVQRSAAALHDESASTRHAGKSRHYRTGALTYFAKHGSPSVRALARTTLQRTA